MSAALTAVYLGDWSNFKNLVSAAILQKRKKNTSNLKSEEPWILKFTLDYDLKYLDEPNQWNWRYGQRLDLGPWTVAMMIMMTTEMMMMTFENILTQELLTLLIGILVSPGELSSSSWEGFLNVNVISSCNRTSPSSPLLATPSPLPSPKSSLPSSDHFSQVLPIRHHSQDLPGHNHLLSGSSA